MFVCRTGPPLTSGPLVSPYVPDLSCSMWWRSHPLPQLPSPPLQNALQVLIIDPHSLGNNWFFLRIHVCVSLCLCAKFRAGTPFLQQAVATTKSCSQCAPLLLKKNLFLFFSFQLRLSFAFLNTFILLSLFLPPPLALYPNTLFWRNESYPDIMYCARKMYGSINRTAV